MKKSLLIMVLIISSITVNAQIHMSLSTMHNMDNKPISSIKLAEDSLCSSSLIIVKEEVKLHKHVYHSENVYIIEGTGNMMLGDSAFSIKSGDYLFIPKNTPHSLKVTSSTPVKILSIQAPRFDGTDRVYIK